MTLPTLVSFSGHSRMGKDAAADLLVAKAGYVKTYVSKPLEEALLALDPLIVVQDSVEKYSVVKQNWGDFVNEEFQEVRRLLAVLKNYFGPNVLGGMFWTGLVFQEVQELLDSGQTVALSGVQHPHELDVVRKLKGVSVWIERPIKRRIGDTTITAEDCDVVVQNDGTLRDLYVNIIEGLEEYDAKKNASADVSNDNSVATEG